MRPATTRAPRLPLLVAVGALPVLAAYAILWREFIPIPLLDDYPSILRFAKTFQQLSSPSQKLLYLVSAQHNEYKLILLHSMVALQLATVHHVNFSVLAWFGNMAPLLMLFVLWRNAFPRVPDPAHRLLLFLPIPFLLFQLNAAETFDWAMAGSQNLGVIAFALVSIHFLLCPTRASFVWAAAAADLACSASASGFLLGPVGLLLLFRARRYRAMLAWCLPFALMLLLYSFRYVRHPPATPVIVRNLPLFFLSFLGSAYENMHHRPIPYLSIAIGLALCLTFAGLFRHRAEPGNSFLRFATLFLVATAALVALGRAGIGLEASLSGRYKIYSDLLLIFGYMSLIGRTRAAAAPIPAPNDLRPVIAAIAAAALLCAASDVQGYKFLNRRRSQLIDGLRQYERSPATATPMLNPSAEAGLEFVGLQEQARVILTSSVDRGLYRPPDLP